MSWQWKEDDNKMNENKKVIVRLYYHVSTDDQSEPGHSLDEQGGS